MAIATTTTLALGTSTIMAAKTHTHVIQLKSGDGDDWFPTSTAMTVSNIHTHHHNMHLMGSNQNHPIGTNAYGGGYGPYGAGNDGGYGPYGAGNDGGCCHANCRN
jgi:hypothetical protein